MLPTQYINDVTCLNKAKDSIANIVRIISFPNYSFSLTRFNTLRRDLGESGQSFTKWINLAILGGEFYSDEAKKIIDEIQLDLIPKLKTQIDQFTSNNIQPDTTLQPILAARSLAIGSNYIDDFIRRYIKSYGRIEDYVKKYSELIEFVRISILGKDYISIKNALAESTDKADTYKLISELEIEPANASFEYVARNRFAIFQLNILLFKTDNALVSTSSVLDRLLEIRRLLQRQIFKGIFISDVLIDKANYLIKKTALRIKDGEKIIDDDIIGNAGKPPLAVKLPITYFSFFDAKTTRHYSHFVTEKASDTEKEFEFIVTTDVAQLEHFHYLNRCYRKGKRKSKIKFLKEQFEKYNKRIVSSNRFDEIAIHTATNLINNTELILLCDESIDRIERADEEKISKVVDDEIEKIYKYYLNSIVDQRKHDRLNFKLHLEFFRYITKVVEVLCQKSIDFKLLNKLISYALSCRNDLKDNLHWEHNKFDLPMFCPFEQSIFLYDLVNQKYVPFSEANPQNPEQYLKLFLDSSYVLPVSYHEMEKSIMKEELKFEHNRNILLDELVEKNLEKSKKDLENEVKNSTKQYISLLGMFATILSFVLGSVKFMSESNNEPVKQITFLIGFAFALISFNMVLEFTIVREKNNRDAYHYVMLGVSMFLAAYALTIFFLSR